MDHGEKLRISFQDQKNFTDGSRETEHCWDLSMSPEPKELAVINSPQIRMDTPAFIYPPYARHPMRCFPNPQDYSDSKDSTGPTLQMGFSKRLNRAHRSVSGRARPKAPSWSFSSPCHIRAPWCMKSFPGRACGMGWRTRASLLWG